MSTQLKTNLAEINAALTRVSDYVNAIISNDEISDETKYGLTLLNWIKADGTGKEIDTGIVIDAVKDTLEVTILDEDISDWEYYFRWSNSQLSRYKSNSSRVRFVYYGSYPEYQTVNYTNVLTTFKFDNGHAWYNGTQFQTWTPKTAQVSNQTTFRIFYPGDKKTCFKFYSAKVTRDGEVIHDIIPVLKDFGGIIKAGLWDKCTKKFVYTENATYTYEIKGVE